MAKHEIPYEMPVFAINLVNNLQGHVGLNLKFLEKFLTFNFNTLSSDNRSQFLRFLNSVKEIQSVRGFYTTHPIIKNQWLNSKEIVAYPELAKQLLTFEPTIAVVDKMVENGFTLSFVLEACPPCKESNY